MRFRRLLPLISLATLAGSAVPAAAQYRTPGHDVPSGSNIDPDIKIEEKINAQVPLDLKFRDTTNTWVSLGDCVAGKPTVLVLGYNRCPMLCNRVLNGEGGLIDTMRLFPPDFTAGRSFSVLFVSVDSKEQPALAAKSRDVFLSNYHEGQRRDGAEKGIHFLVGGQPAIDAITNAVGFRFKFDKQYKEFNHPSGIIILTPTGKVARYFNGVAFSYPTGNADQPYTPRDYQTADGGTTTVYQTLLDAAGEKTGGLAPGENRLFSCFRLDWLEKKFGKNVLLVVRIAGAVSVLALAAGLVYLIRRQPRPATTPAGPAADPPAADRTPGAAT